MTKKKQTVKAWEWSSIHQRMEPPGGTYCGNQLCCWGRNGQRAFSPLPHPKRKAKKP